MLVADAVTVKDLNLTQEQREEACFLLNYRNSWGFERQAYSWGAVNMHEFTAVELRECLDREMGYQRETATRSPYGFRMLGQLDDILRRKAGV
jgi:hypothetical protein